MTATAYDARTRETGVEAARDFEPRSRHDAGLASQLSTLPGLYRECEQFLEENRRPRNTQRLSGWRPSDIRLNPVVVEVRATVVHVLASWCGLIIQERGVAGPGRRTVEDLARFLGTHLHWLTAHAAAADFAGELAGLVGSMREAIHSVPLSRVELGPCAHPGCGRAMSATIGGDSPRNQVKCDAGHVWQPHQWLLLNGQLEQARHMARPASVRSAT